MRALGACGIGSKPVIQTMYNVLFFFQHCTSGIVVPPPFGEYYLIKGSIRLYGVLAQRLERLPYKRLMVVQFNHTPPKCSV